jgi:hypothetical protein
MRRAGGCCEDCGRSWAETRPTLHHLRYFTEIEMISGDLVGGDPIDGRETADDLAALCWDCHQDRHRDPNGEYWRDPQDMEEHWAGYYQELEKP